ncbi:hypothetical protein RJT34_15641 [Clitoria ternatea]|uniref:Uncharacterized protein n=1 Tax=Clitoria ternatea TaxID=43366 RepID=A0AAN9PBL9_CLITE
MDIKQENKIVIIKSTSFPSIFSPLYPPFHSPSWLSKTLSLSYFIYSSNNTLLHLYTPYIPSTKHHFPHQFPSPVISHHIHLFIFE